MFDLSLLLEQLVIILVAARIAGQLVRPLGQPRVIGEMLAGILLGPSLFGALAPNVSHALFPASSIAPLTTLSQLGVLLFMFVVGLRLDLSVLRERAGAAVAVSHASIAVPFILGAGVAPLLHTTLAGTGLHGEGVAVLPFALFLGAAMSVTAFPVLARILAERKLLNTHLGAVAIASAAVDDVTAWCILAAVVAVARAQNAIGSFAFTIAEVSAYTAALVFGGRRLLLALDHRRVERREPVSPEIVGIAIVVALASALLTERIGVHALFGAFIAGTIMPRESGLARELADRMEPVVSTVLLPVFFAITGLRTEIGLVSTPSLWSVCALVITLAIVGKFGGSFVAARAMRLSWRDSFGIGILMNTRGLMELVVLNVGLDLGVISKTLFAIMVLMALLTTFMTSPLLALLLRGAPQPAAVRTPAS